MDGKLRLMNRNTQSRFEGRVEICFSGVWGTICSDGWDSRDATVVCRELGIAELLLGIDLLTMKYILVEIEFFHPLAAIPLLSSETYGEGDGPIFLKEMDCGQQDTRLVGCNGYNPTSVIDKNHCTHAKDAAVICKGT